MSFTITIVLFQLYCNGTVLYVWYLIEIVHIVNEHEYRINCRLVSQRSWQHCEWDWHDKYSSFPQGCFFYGHTRSWREIERTDWCQINCLIWYRGTSAHVLYNTITHKDLQQIGFVSMKACPLFFPLVAYWKTMKLKLS